MKKQQKINTINTTSNVSRKQKVCCQERCENCARAGVTCARTVGVCCCGMFLQKRS